MLPRFITKAPSFILGKLFLEETSLNPGSQFKYSVVSILIKRWSGTKHFHLYVLLP